MRLLTLAFLAGVLLLQQFTTLPPWYWLVIISIIVIIIELFLTKKSHHFRLVSATLVGFAWTLGYAHFVLTKNLPQEWEGKPLFIRGFIASIPTHSDHRSAFLFDVKKPFPLLIKLSLQNPNINLHAGDEWQFRVRLKRIHGLMNPGGFDYEAWAFQTKIRATGYVVRAEENILLSQHGYRYTLDRIRERLKEQIEKNLPQSNTSPWIIALALGERQNISAENWQILRNTGTNHLMAIAGLHIGFMAGFIFFLAEWCWRCVPRLTLLIPSLHAGAIAALLMAFIYSALAGFSLPTERACIMLSVTLLVLLMRRIHLTWQSFSVALLLILIINPLSVLTDSFWLSFCSVALIIYGVSGRLAPAGLWWKLGRIQWVIALGLIPLSIGLFQACSLISFVANSIAIPWIGFVVVPLTLFGCFLLLFSTKLASIILSAADHALHFLWNILTYLSHLSWAVWYHMIPTQWILWVAFLSMVILLLPAGFKGRYLGLIGLLPLIFYHYPRPNLGEVWFTLLDVGQGLSAVLQTKNHIAVFDTGARLSSNYDMGESVVTPFLLSIGAKKIDLLVVSHGDNDHSGGALALYQHFPITLVKTSDKEKILPIPSQYCLRGESWEWDHVKFEFLYPPAENLDLDNNSSCVLRVTDANNQHILLTGDIEKLAEKYLTTFSAENLAANILVAPHHGSKTSSTQTFINQIHPQFVLFPVGYRNRYHFPHAIVIEKYLQLHAKLFSSVESGAIQFKLSEHDEPILYRMMHKHYW